MDFSCWVCLLAWSPNFECRPYRFDRLLCGKFILSFQVLHSRKKEILVWLLLHSWCLKRKPKVPLWSTHNDFRVQDSISLGYFTFSQTLFSNSFLLPSPVNVDMVLLKRTNHFLDLIFKWKSFRSQACSSFHPYQVDLA